MQDTAPPPTHYEDLQSRRQISEQALAYMQQLDGWCSPEKARFLIDLICRAQPKVIVEIGVWGGKSLIPMAYALKVLNQGMIYGIDPWESKESVQWIMEDVNRAFWSWANHDWILQGLLAKIQQFDLGSQITLIKDTSEKAPPIYGIDILHIDGNHSEHTSYIDVTKWVPLVNSGGWIIFDDMTWFENGQYTAARATQWLDEHCHKFAEFSDICTWGVWVKP